MPFKKGNCANPGGRGKDGPIWSNALRRQLAGKNNAEQLRRLATKVIDMALEGDMQAVKEIGDRLEGKPAQIIYGAGDNGEIPIGIVIKYVGKKSAEEKSVEEKEE